MGAAEAELARARTLVHESGAAVDEARRGVRRLVELARRHLPATEHGPYRQLLGLEPSACEAEQLPALVREGAHALLAAVKRAEARGGQLPTKPTGGAPTKEDGSRPASSGALSAALSEVEARGEAGSPATATATATDADADADAGRAPGEAVIDDGAGALGYGVAGGPVSPGSRVLADFA